MVEELKTIEMGFYDYIAARQKEFDWLRQGKEQGFEAGLQQGAYQNKMETARAFLAYGDAPEKVALCTGLPVETVRELEREVNPKS